MNTNEFIDTYSDDLLYLEDARSALMTHPLRDGNETYLDPSLCRLAIVFSIGAVEAMLGEWRVRDQASILEPYFATRSSNRTRIMGLYDAFCSSGIEVDRDVFEDYLAIKFLRNTIVHSEWKESEKILVCERGFPTDTRKLTKEHLDKIDDVTQNMFFYIAMTEYASRLPPNRTARLKKVFRPRTEEPGILRIGDLNAIIWRNLERIHSKIEQDIDKAIVEFKFNWAEGHTKEELEQLGHERRKWLYYTGARRAGQDDLDLFSESRAFAQDAFEFWCEYLRRMIAPNLNEERVNRALSILRSSDFDPTNKKWSFAGQIDKLEDDVAVSMVGSILGKGSLFTPEEVVDALRVGRLAWRIFPNISPVYLFSVCLPIVDPENTSKYCIEARFAYRMSLLSRTWYSCVESSSEFVEDEIKFPIHLAKEFDDSPDSKSDDVQA